MKKLLILSSNNGQGHNSVAQAIIEAAEARGDAAVMIDALLFVSPQTSEFIEKVYINGTLHTPKLIGTGNEFAELLEKAGVQSREFTQAARHLTRFIRANRFDSVIATHVFAAQILSSVDAEVRQKLTTAFVATDYSYVPFTSDTALDFYFLPHKKLLADFLKSAPGRNYVISGIPTRAAMREKRPKEEARGELALPQDRPIAIIMTGSMGFGDALPLLDALLLRSTDAYIVVMCGNNEKLRKTLTERYGASGRVKPISYTNQVSLYLDAADVLLSKPGGLSSTEAAVKEIPLVHMNPLPGWEEENVRFFAALGMSLSGKTAEEMADAAASLLSDRAAAQQMMRRQGEEINKHAADDVLDAMSL